MKYLLCLLALISTPALAQVLSDTSILPAGHYVWSDQAALGHLHVTVNLKTQMAYVYDSANNLVGETAVSTGRDGFETEVGHFAVQGKEINHVSKKYHAAMPYTMWFDEANGVALHAGGDPGQPSSHGCVHMPKAFVAQLYEMLQVGDGVDITNAAPEFALNL